MKERLKRIAMDNYNNGGDVMVECWDEKQWDEFIADGGDEELLKTIMSIHHERYCDAMISGGLDISND